MIETGFIDDSRISASSVPKMMPPVMDSNVSVTVKVIPSRKRYPAERWMTSQSNPAPMSVPRHGGAADGDQPRHANARFQPTHEHDDDEVGEEIQHRRRGEGLEHVERHFLHGARAPGELEEPDG